MNDKMNFEYDMNAEFDNLMSGTSSKAPSKAPTPAQQKTMGSQANNQQMSKAGPSKKEPLNDVPEPDFIQQ